VSRYGVGLYRMDRRSQCRTCEGVGWCQGMRCEVCDGEGTVSRRDLNRKNGRQLSSQWKTKEVEDEAD
jgi:DnaJ-class molecular chaperone